MLYKTGVQGAANIDSVIQIIPKLFFFFFFCVCVHVCEFVFVLGRSWEGLFRSSKPIGWHMHNSVSSLLIKKHLCGSLLRTVRPGHRSTRDSWLAGLDLDELGQCSCPVLPTNPWALLVIYQTLIMKTYLYCSSWTFCSCVFSQLTHRGLDWWQTRL